MYRSGASNAQEAAANKFAGELLMPKKAIIDKAHSLINKSPDKTMDGDKFITEMSKIFEVSKPAMLVRLKVLRIISQDFNPQF